MLAAGAFEIDENELAELQLLAANFEVAVVLHKGKGKQDIIDGVGVANEKTKASLIDAVFGTVPTANLSKDSRRVAGWTTDLSFLVVDLTPEARQSFFGAHTYIQKTVSYLKHGNVGSKPEPASLEVVVCIIDTFPPHIVGDVMFDSSLAVGDPAPGIACTLFLGDCRQVKMNSPVACRSAMAEVLADVQQQLDEHGQGLKVKPVGAAGATGASELRGPSGMKQKVWLIGPAGQTTREELIGALLPALALMPHHIGVVRDSATQKVVTQPVYSTATGDSPEARAADRVGLKWAVRGAEDTATVHDAGNRYGGVSFRIGGVCEEFAKAGRSRSKARRDQRSTTQKLARNLDPTVLAAAHAGFDPFWRRDQKCDNFFARLSQPPMTPALAHAAGGLAKPSDAMVAAACKGGCKKALCAWIKGSRAAADDAQLTHRIAAAGGSPMRAAPKARGKHPSPQSAGAGLAVPNGDRLPALGGARAVHPPAGEPPSKVARPAPPLGSADTGGHRPAPAPRRLEMASGGGAAAGAAISAAAPAAADAVPPHGAPTGAAASAPAGAAEFASALGVPAVPPSPGGNGMALVGGWNAERGADGNDVELPEGPEADAAAAVLDMLTSDRIGELLVWGTLKGEIPAERQAKAEEIIAMLHSHALVKGYSGGNAVPLHAASHLRFLVGGDETVAMVE